jgi:hypothetical protein
MTNFGKYQRYIKTVSSPHQGYSNDLFFSFEKRKVFTKKPLKKVAVFLKITLNEK